MAFSIIQCGSTARGDANVNSDVDIICIWSRESPDFTRLIHQYGEITFYSVETIRRMRAKGSLFLAHLDVDGVFIGGDQTLLEEFRGFRPAARQVRSLYKNTEKFIANLEWFPNSSLGELWLCDVLYVALRTCVYCKNAVQGVYNFGYLGALKACGLSSGEIALMLLIREGKYLYRNSENDSGRVKIEIDSDLAQKACYAVLSETVNIARGGMTNWAKLSREGYWSERLVERAILNKEHSDNEFMLKIKRHGYHKTSLRSDVSRIVGLHKSNR